MQPLGSVLPQDQAAIVFLPGLDPGAEMPRIGDDLLECPFAGIRIP
jgi:hypothetical protein